jgi:hypothetical protein
MTNGDARIRRSSDSFIWARRYARAVTPEELADLAHLRRARDLIDR